MSRIFPALALLPLAALAAPAMAQSEIATIDPDTVYDGPVRQDAGAPYGEWGDADAPPAYGDRYRGYDNPPSIDSGRESIGHLSAILSDPARQEEFAARLATLSAIILDMPLAPLIEPVAEMAGEVAGEDFEEIDPDMTLRRAAPGSKNLPTTIRTRLPQAMERMARVSEGFGRMLPALRDMASRIERMMPAMRERGRHDN